MFRLRLKEIRETKGISQKQLAIALNISQGAIGNWESGTRKPNYEYVKLIADYFDVSTDYLLGIEDNANNLSLSPDSLTATIINETKALSDEEKEDVLTFIRFIKNKNKKQPKKERPQTAPKRLPKRLKI